MKKFVLPLLTIVCFASASLHAATVTWIGSAGDWTDGEDWSNTTGPGTADTALIINSGVVELGSAVTIAALQVGASGTGTLDINSGAALSITNGMTLGTGGTNSTGTINQSGGAVTTASISMGASTSSRKGFYNLSGGTLDVSGNVTLGSSGNGTFTQTGGTVTIVGELRMVTGVNNASVSTVTAGSYSISAGTLNVANIVNGYFSNASQGIGRATFSVSGSKAAINVSGNYTTGTQSAVTPKRESYLSYAIDSGGVTKINLTGTGTATLAGTLSASFVGGMALTGSTEYRLLEANTGNISGAFDYVTASAVWDAPEVKAVSGSRDALVISLDVAAKVGDLAYTGSFTELSFGVAEAMGYVTVSDLDTDSPFRFSLAVDTGSSDLAVLLAYFTANGLVATASEVEGFDVDVYFNPTAATSYFAWDMTQFDATASISAMGLEAVPEPSTVALLALSGLGMLWHVRRRQRVA